MHNNENTTDDPAAIAEAPDTTDISDFIQPLYASRLWIQIFAACLIFYSALVTVTGVGVLVAWIPMWIGVLLFSLAKSIRTAYEQDSKEMLLKSLMRLKTVFTILGISSIALITASLYLLKYAIDKSLF